MSDFKELLPRKHHYIFAHRLLPYLAFRSREQLAALLESPQATRALVHLWDTLGDKLSVEERIPGDQIEVFYETLEGGWGAAVVRMPPARRTAEAHFVGILFGPAADEGGAQSKRRLRYVTLEKHVALIDEEGPRSGTMLCEWTGEQGETHANMGEGPEPDVDAFWDELKRIARADGVACLGKCPQHIDIPTRLKEVAEALSR